MALNLLLGFLLLISIVIGAYLELLYARANYPKSWYWTAGLFCIGSFIGGLGSYLVIVRIDQESLPLPILIFALLFGGIGFTWLFPARMRYVIPPTRKQS
jgi:hypothetical protein